MTCDQVRRTAPAASLLALSLLLAGCSPSTVSGPDQTVVSPATATRPAPASAPMTTAPAQPHASAMAACLQEHGWDAQVSVRGDSVFSTLPDDDTDSYGTDRAWCATALGVPSGPSGPGSPESPDLDAWREVGACLAGHGIATDPLPEDAEQVERSWTQGRPSWNPYYAAGGEGLLIQAVEACPPPVG